RRPPRRSDPPPRVRGREGSQLLHPPPRSPAGLSFVERRMDGHIGVVTLNRPESMNAISGEVADELGGAFLQTAADPSVWVIVLAAAGEKAFCVGADLKERGNLDDRGWLRNRVLMRSMFDSIRAVPQPTVASVFGYALGGGF